MTIYRYFTIDRPPMLGGVPKENMVRCEAYEEPVRNPFRGNVWGYVDYSEPLTDDQVQECELSYVGEFED